MGYYPLGFCLLEFLSSHIPVNVGVTVVQEEQHEQEQEQDMLTSGPQLEAVYHSNKYKQLYIQ